MGHPIDDLIRRTHRGTRTTTPPAPEATDPQAAAAAAAGLPAELAHRLSGTTADELAADARALAGQLGYAARDFDGGARGTKPSSQPQSIDDAIRRAAGR